MRKEGATAENDLEDPEVDALQQKKSSRNWLAITQAKPGESDPIPRITRTS